MTGSDVLLLLALFALVLFLGGLWADAPERRDARRRQREPRYWRSR